MCIYQSIAGVVESQSSTSVIQGYFFFFLIITRRQKLKTPLEMAEATDRPTDRPNDRMTDRDLTKTHKLKVINTLLHEFPATDVLSETHD